jgi:hypothetical protein
MERENINEALTVSCQTLVHTICRKNIGNDKLPVSPVGRI